MLKNFDELMNKVKSEEKIRRVVVVCAHDEHALEAVVKACDDGMCMYPDLVQKKQIIENNVQMLLNMGYEKPNVAVLTAVEKVNPKMQETVDAAELKKMYLNGEIENCYVEGPISYDIAMDKESAQIKGVDSPVTENADILIVPNITTGNILGKTYIFTAKAKMAGLVLGAKCPIVLTSRGAAMQEKYLSLSIAALSVN